MVKPPRRPNRYNRLLPLALTAGAGALYAGYKGAKAGYNYVASKFASKTKSGSKVKFKNKSKTGNAIFSGQSAITRWNKYAPRIKMSQRTLLALTQPNHLEWNGASRLTAPSGSQCATSYLQHDGAPITAMYNAVQAGTGSNKSGRIFLQDCFFEYAFANASNALTNVDIYDVSFKRELDPGDTPNILPDGAWNAGEINEGNSLGLTMIGSYPTRTDQFKQFYKIEKKESHVLAPGDVHRHKIHVQVRKFMTGNRITTSCRYAGITTATMVVANGNPIDNVGSTTGQYDLSGDYVNSIVDASGNLQSNVTAGTVSTAPVALNIVWRVRYTYRWINDNDTDTGISNGLTVIASPEVMQNTGSILPYGQS